MNDQQIKAELRRSACEDDDPFITVDSLAFDEAKDWKVGLQSISVMEPDDCRLFFLLVAEAL